MLGCCCRARADVVKGHQYQSDSALCPNKWTGHSASLYQQKREHWASREVDTVSLRVLQHVVSVKAIQEAITGLLQSQLFDALEGAVGCLHMMSSSSPCLAVHGN